MVHFSKQKQRNHFSGLFFVGIGLGSFFQHLIKTTTISIKNTKKNVRKATEKVDVSGDGLLYGWVKVKEVGKMVDRRCNMINENKKHDKLK